MLKIFPPNNRIPLEEATPQMTFPNTTNLASFTPESQLIMLNEITEPKFLSSYKHNGASGVREELAIIYHEVTHWADTVGTIWGNEYLKTAYSAYDVMPVLDRSGSEASYHHFLRLHDANRRLKHDDYYRVMRKHQPDHSLSHPWRISFSSGVEFNGSGLPDENRPICFVKFGNNPSDELLVRQPLSIASLLETTATWSELSTHFHLVGTLNEDEKFVETHMLTQRFGKNLYTPELTVYSSPVHLLAHHTRMKNAAEAYHFSALLALVCLNLVGSHFSRLKVPGSFNAWGARISAFKRNESRPFAFMVICENGPKWEPGMPPWVWIDAALAASGLPSFQEILSHAVDVLTADEQHCNRAEMAVSQRYMRMLGAKWLAYRRDQKDSAINIRHLSDGDLILPAMYDAEGNVFSVFGKGFDTSLFDLETMFDAEAELRSRVRNFRNACR